jgi:superfamily II DNA or RNA helicase
MLQECRWAQNHSYRTGKENEPLEFYLTALAASRKFDLLLGYFSSSAINVLALGFAKFLHNGGTMRIIANNVLSQEDKRAIEIGQEGKPLYDVLDLRDIRKLKAALDETGRHFFECLAWLIRRKRIEFVIVKPKGRMGISHYKSGIFSDGFNEVGFKASCNFTAFGMLENLEELDVFHSWEGGRSSSWLNEQKEYFENIYSGSGEFVEYVPIEEVQVAIRTEFGNKDIGELLDQEKGLLSKRERLTSTPILKSLIKKIEEELDAAAKEPRFPHPSGPRAYQEVAYQKWLANNRRGVFAMATGTGKTITALNALLQQYRLHGVYQCLILVPSITLVEQWYAECRAFNFQTIVKASSLKPWDTELSSLLLQNRMRRTSFIVIATYATFRTERFRTVIESFPDDGMIIADEAHNLGAPGVKALLAGLTMKNRIGLSATVERKYDEIGNEAIDLYFSDHHPYVYSLSMKEALEEGWLCKYYYYPHIVRLSAAEMEEYVVLSKKICQYYNSSDASFRDNPQLSALLIKRKRIIDKAASKLDAFKKIMKERYASGGSLAYSLAYIPEGSETDYSTKDHSMESADELRLIDEYTRAVRDIDSRILVMQFTANTDDRDRILKEFSDGRIDVLTSMKCLDEGVDVPRTEFAVFCASSTNSRQFIQRRGRVLRKATGKEWATIHDLIVVPNPSMDRSTFSMERSLFKKELERVLDFAELSENRIDSYVALETALTYYELSLYSSDEKP